jgi:hypothetical protein
VGVGLDAVDPHQAVWHHSVGGRPRDDRVVTLGHVEVAEDGLDHRLAGLDVEALVTDGVAVVRRDGVGDHVGEPHVGVAEQESTTSHRVDAGRALVEQVVRGEMDRYQRVVGHRRLVRQIPRPVLIDR